MTVDRRLRHARLALAGGVLLAALGWGVAVAGGWLLLVALLDLAIGLSWPARQALAVGGVMLGVAAAIAILWRNRGAASLTAVALWLEGRAPSMRYALVTLVEGRHPAMAPRLEQAVANASWSAPLRQTVLRAAGVPLLAAAVVIVALAALPHGVVARMSAPAPGDILTAPARPEATSNPLRPVVVTLVPPAYSGLRKETVEDPETIVGLQGTSVRISGRGAPSSLTVQLGNRSVPVGTSETGWALGFIMPDSVVALRLEAGGITRLIVVSGTPDSLPVVQLTAPARDTVWRAPGGPLPLHAEIHDDYGLADGWFEFVVTSGAGERFTFRSGVAGRRALDGARDAKLDATLSLDSLHLVPGDVVHLRAVARDRNLITGPDTGYSETRMLRVPRAGEGDSVSVYAAAPADADSSLLSQRMLILLAEGLQRRRPRLKAGLVLQESRAIAKDQAALRRQVATIIFHRLGGEASAEESGDADTAPLTPEELLAAAEQATEQNENALDFAEDETPVVAVNRPLLEAYNAMWVAGRELEQGQPGRALPPMREALAAILRARAAERIYLRGRPPVAVVDLARVRLAGKLTDVHPSPAHGQPVESGSVAALLDRFTLAVDALPRSAAVDSLAVLRLDAMRALPEFAAALDRALVALQSGRDATDALLAARRTLTTPVVAVPTLPAWGWP
ncbi:MAG: hypothetical protein R2910_12810 [Gemmatimonadales bacterium]